MLFNHSVKYGEYLRKRDEAYQAKQKRKDELYQAILKLAKQNKTNLDIATELGISYPSLMQHKSKMRELGLDIPVKSGRPSAPRICPHCGRQI